MQRLYHNFTAVIIPLVVAGERFGYSSASKEITPSLTAKLRQITMKFHVILFLILLWLVFSAGISACQDDPRQVNQDYPTVVSDLATSEANVSMLSATLVAHQTQPTSTPDSLDELASMQATAMTLRTEVEAQANTILAHQIAALSLTKLETDFETAVLLAIEANQLADTSTTRSSLLYAFQHNPRLQNVIRFTDVGGVQDVAFSPDGRYLALAHGGGQLLLYDLFADRLIGELLPGLSEEFAGEGDGYPTVAFSPDGQFLVGTNPTSSSENENKIVIWDFATQQIVATSPHIVLDAIFLPEENYLVTHDYKGVTVWDFSGGNLEEVSNLPVPQDSWESGLSSMAGHPDGEIIALGYRVGTINLWNPFTNELSSLSSMIQADYIYNLVFNPDGTILAISIPGQIILWDMVNNQAFGIISHNSSAVSFSQDGQSLLSIGGDESLYLWDVATQAPIGEPFTRWGNSHLLAGAALHPDGQIIASIYQNRTAILWDATATSRLGQALAHFPIEEQTGLYYSEAFVDDDNTLLASNSNGALASLDISTGQVISTTPGYADPNLRDVVFNENYTIAATHIYTNEVSTITLYDVRQDRPIGQPIQQIDFVSALAFTPDGTRLVTGDTKGLLRFYDSASGLIIGEPFQDHARAVETLAFNLDGQIVASGSYDEIHLRDVTTFELVAPPISANGDQLIFHPIDNTLIVIRFGGSPIYAWDTTSGELKGNLTERGEVMGLVFSPDGQYITSAELEYINYGSRARFTAIREADSWLQIGPSLDWHWHPVFNHDGSLLATTYLKDGRTTEIVLWDMRVETWREKACQTINQNLTTEQWKLYFGDRPYEKTCPAWP